AEDLRPGRRTGDLVDLGLAVDRKEPHTQRIGAGDVALLLDGIAIGDAVRRGARRQHHLDLGDRGGVEAGAELDEERQHLGRWVGLHRVKDARVGQRLGEGGVVVAHDVEVDDQARAVLPTPTEEFTDALGHLRILQLKGTDLAVLVSRLRSWRAVRDGDALGPQTLTTAIAALAWRGDPAAL